MSLVTWSYSYSDSKWTEQLQVAIKKLKSLFEHWFANTRLMMTYNITDIICIAGWYVFVHFHVKNVSQIVYHVSTELCHFMRIVIWHYWQISDHIGSLLDWRKCHRTMLQILKSQLPNVRQVEVLNISASYKLIYIKFYGFLMCSVLTHY